jgi:predicted site-specific integrase-resolvase
MREFGGDMITTAEAASILKRTVITLLRWRRAGYGPEARKFGREWAYSRTEVEEFARKLDEVKRL